MKNLQITARPLSSIVYSLKLSHKMIDGEINFLGQEIANPDLINHLFEKFKFEEIVIRSDEVLLKKSPLQKNDWQGILKEVAQTLREAYSKNQLNFTPKKKDSFKEAQSSNLPPELNGIHQTLEQQILPALAQHGGSVKIVNFSEGVLRISFSGGCQGCAQSTITVKNGIEKLLKEKFPLIKEVQDVTLHTEGENPYYK